MPVHQRANPRALAQMPQRADQRMVQQVLPDRPVKPDRYTERLQHPGRPDAGPLQQRR